MFKYFIILFFILSFDLNAKDSLLTLKQQIDRLQREVNDLSKSVFQDSGYQFNQDQENSNRLSELTAFDLRIYGLEKDIKKLNENFEEIIFQIDDLQIMFKNLSIEFLNTNNFTKIDDQNIVDENNFSISTENLIKDEKNTLGTLVINSNDLSNTTNKEVLVDDNQDISQDDTAEVIKTLTPEEEFQKAFDMIRNQQFSDAKIALQSFIKKNKDAKLSGSAHYWLGEIYLLKKEYREAALIFAEGYQKFPLSYKAPDMLYKLSDSLINIDKKKDACSTLEKLLVEFPKHKLSTKVKNQIKFKDCANMTE